MFSKQLIEKKLAKIIIFSRDDLISKKSKDYVKNNEKIFRFLLEM